MKRISATLLFAIAIRVAAQEQSAAIEGAVYDPSGAAVERVRVVAHADTGFEIATTTDSHGVYRLLSLPPTRYTVTAHADGFSDVAMNVELPVGAFRSVNFHLNAPEVRASIEVAAKAPDVDVEQTAVTNRIAADVFDHLPHGRDFTSIVTYTTAVNDEERLHGLSINGASGAENQYSLDGADITDPLSGTAGKIVIPDVIDEIQVKLAGYTAEFGGATGGVINVLTRSGSNELRGSLSAYYTNAAWSGSPRPTLLVNGVGLAYGQYSPHKDHDSTLEPGITMSGPIARDRLWFFAAFQPTLTSTRRVVAFNDGQQGTFTREFDRRNTSVNVTFVPAPRVTGKVATNLSGYTARGALPPASGVTASDPSAYRLDESYQNETYSGYIDFAITPALILHTQGGALRTNDRVTGLPQKPRAFFDAPNAAIPGIPPDLIHAAGFYNYPNNYGTDHDGFDRDHFELSLQYATESRLGDHLFKTGAQFERLTNDVLSGMAWPLYDFYWNDDNPLIGADGRGTYGSLLAEVERDSGHVTSRNQALFAQDSWVLPNRRVTLNIGVRAEQENIPSYADPSLGMPHDVIDFHFGDKLAPRLGIAYDLTGEQTWKLYANYGLFYDRVKLALPRRAFGGYKDVLYNFRLNTWNWPDIECTGLNGLPNDQPTCNPGVDFVSLEDDAPLPVAGSYRVDPALKPMESREWSAGVEHQLRSVHVSVSAIHRELVRTIEDVGIWNGQRYALTIANPGYGTAEQVKDGIPPLPKAVRRYDAVQLDATTSQTGRVWAHASYMFSRLWGNYSGLFNSDELQDRPVYGSTWANTPYGLFGSNGKPVYGRLATDRPHQLKLQGFAHLPWRVTIGVNQYAASGTPISEQMRYGNALFFPYGRGNAGRTPAITQTDALIAKRFGVTSRVEAELSLNVVNVFDQRAVTSVYQVYSIRSLPLTEAEFFAGFDAAKIAAGLPKDPRYGAPFGYQPARQITAAARLEF